MQAGTKASAPAAAKRVIMTVVTLGESMMVFNGPHHSPIGHGTAITASLAGAESNVAIGLARLGHRVRWLSVVGADLFGQVILRTLRGERVDVSGVQVSSQGPTAVMFKNRRGYAEPEVFYYRAGSAFSQVSAGSFPPELWRDARLIYLTGITPALSNGCRELIRQVLEDARQHGVPVWFDPNFRRKLWSEEDARDTLRPFLPYVDVLLAGLSEGQILTGEPDPREIADSLLQTGPRQVVLKRGENGASLFTRDGEISHPAFPARHVIDPIGAGDGFVAGFMAATLEDLPPNECLRRGAAVGAIVCQVEGDWEGLPLRAELERFLDQNVEAER